MASVTYGKCIMANVIMAKIFMAKILWQMKLSRKHIRIIRILNTFVPKNDNIFKDRSRKGVSFLCIIINSIHFND